MQGNLIRTALLKDQIYDYIVDAIQNGKLKPGEKLTEAALCNTLGVSRTPVREALTKLAAEDVIDRIPRRGFFVRVSSTKEQADTYIVDYALEVLAAELFMGCCNEQLIDELSALVDSMEAALSARDFETCIKSNLAAHNFVVSHCGNKPLIELINHFLKTTVTIYYETDNPEIIPILTECVREHREMIAAFRTKDLDALKRVYYTHLVEDKRY